MAGSQQPRDTAVALTVTLDRPDWRYQLGDSARFTVSLARAGRPLRGVPVRVDVGPELMPPDRTDTVVMAGATRTVTAALAYPGLLRTTATAIVDGTSYTAFATASFSPERIQPTATMPADFEAFWRAAIAEARRVPLEPRLTRLPERSTPDVDVFHVSFQNHRAGSRLYGMLSVPTRPGRYPAMLVVPGAGVRPYFPSVATARRGVIHLAIGIHGIPVDRDSLLYNELRATALEHYRRAGIEDRDAYYFKRVIVGVVRAGDFLFSLPQFDGRNYVVRGGSQGGGLAIMAGALDTRVKAIAAAYPAMSDHEGYLHGRAGGWPHIFQDTAGMKAFAEKRETLRYYDAVNFARLLRVPGIFCWGFNDRVVPPTSVFAAYNVITAPKQSCIVPEAEHFLVPSQSRRIEAWLFERMGVADPAPEGAAYTTPAAAGANAPVTETALGGCVRVHHIWEQQLAAVRKTAAGSAERTEVLLATVYRPYREFWAGYLGAKDEAGFTRWIREAWRLEEDPRIGIPLSADLGAMIVEATRKVATLMRREQACSDWYLVYGPGWTNMGGLTAIGMVADFLGMPRERGLDDFRAYLPHEVAHVAWGSGHRGDPDAGTLLERIVGEGFATWFSDMYWGDSLSAAQAFGYTEEDLQRAITHERELWAAARPLLPARDRRTLDRFAAVRERVLPNAPGKAGYFIGYRIVDAYVARHGPDSWRDLIDMPYAQILARSGYDASLTRPGNASGATGEGSP